MEIRDPGSNQFCGLYMATRLFWVFRVNLLIRAPQLSDLLSVLPLSGAVNSRGSSNFVILLCHHQRPQSARHPVCKRYSSDQARSLLQHINKRGIIATAF